LEDRLPGFEKIVHNLLDQEWDNALMELQVSRAAASGEHIDTTAMEAEGALTALETQQLVAERRAPEDDGNA
jgi:hypothetical protein